MKIVQKLDGSKNEIFFLSHSNGKIFFFFLIFLSLLVGCKSEQKEISKKKAIAKGKIVRQDEFGMSVDSFVVKSGKVKKRQTFSDILYSFDIPYKKIFEIADSAKGKFDVRKIRRGDEYFLYFGKDSVKTPRYFVLKRDLVNFVVFKIDSPITVVTKKKKVSYVRKKAGGVISNSLYETLSEENLSPQLALELSEIFAWQIDFYRIQKGDAFKVIYDEKYVDGKPIGVGEIYAAYFLNRGTEYYAFLFKQGNEEDYFDEEGNSLRKAFLKSPIKFGHITSRYSLHRYHPILHRVKAHLGTDYAAPIGTPIRATGDGVVIEARYKRNNGNYVKIKHNSVYMTQYLHMSRFAKGIRPGVKVKQGQIIGYVGMTGLATGPHVCYRFWKNGKQVDHLKEKFPSTNPVKKEYKERFLKEVKQLKTELDEITFSNADSSAKDSASAVK